MPRKKAPTWQQQDPHFARESQKYDGQPVPSREFILQTLANKGARMDMAAFCHAFSLVHDADVQGLLRRLRAMEREAQVVWERGYYRLPGQPTTEVTGRVIGHAEGHGFLAPDAGGENLFLAPQQMRRVLHGDKVQARVTGVNDFGRLEAQITQVLERNTHTVVGRFHERHRTCCVIPENKRMCQEILIPPEERGIAQHQNIVVVELLPSKGLHHTLTGRVKVVLGDYMAPGMEVLIAIAHYGIPVEWPPEVLEQAQSLGETVPENALAGRKDLRHLPLVTIDGITARDFDDAVYCERRKNTWQLWVAIADVSAYVEKGTPLDEEARRRGNSVYFPDRAIPMLPEALSNGLCSLNPNVDRLCMVCMMSFDDTGTMIRSTFFEAVMRSHARLTYDTVAEIIAERHPQVRETYAALVPHLDQLCDLYRVLRTAREKRGAIDFETQETVIQYGADGKIDKILPSERNEAHKLIEECMIMANVAAARFLQRHKIPGLHRVHEGPTTDRLQKLRGFLGRLGLPLGGQKVPEPQDYAALLAKIVGRPDLSVIQTVMLRSLSQAVYQPERLAHFGLALPAYAHFTSPIRRYPDLQVHRAIRHILQKKPLADFDAVAGLQALGEHCSMTERRADEAVRDATDWLKCEYMQDKVGDVFEGIISGVTGFGLFVTLSEVFVDGLVHISALGDDYYVFDPIGHLLSGDRLGKIYRLGDPMSVRLVRVDLDQRKIDFEPCRQQKKGGRKKTP